MQKTDYEEYLEFVQLRDAGAWPPPPNKSFHMEFSHIVPLRVVQARYMFLVLKHFGGNRTYAAKAMKISLRTLRNHISNWWGGARNYNEKPDSL